MRGSPEPLDPPPLPLPDPAGQGRRRGRSLPWTTSLLALLGSHLTCCTSSTLLAPWPPHHDHSHHRHFLTPSRPPGSSPCLTSWHHSCLASLKQSMQWQIRKYSLHWNETYFVFETNKRSARMIITAKKLFQYCKKGYHKPLLKIYITRKVKGPYLIVASSYYLMFSGAATSSGLLNSCVWALSKVLTITCSLCQDKTSIFYCQGWEVCQKNMQQNIGFCPNWLDPPSFLKSDTKHQKMLMWIIGYFKKYIVIEKVHSFSITRFRNLAKKHQNPEIVDNLTKSPRPVFVAYDKSHLWTVPRQKLQKTLVTDFSRLL